MWEYTVSYTGVLVAAIITIVIGSLWYSPLLFGKQWMKLSGMSDAELKKAKEVGMGQTYVLALVGALLMAYVLAMLVQALDATTAKDGAVVGFWMWVGFLVPTLLGSVLWEKKSWSLFAINAAYYLVVLKITGAVLAVWG